MEDPRMWASTPFRNQTAWVDLIGRVDLYHRALAERIFQLTGRSVASLPLGNGGDQEWLLLLQQVYTDEARALNLPPPPDLESYDLSQPGDFASWTFTLSQATRQLALTVGFA